MTKYTAVCVRSGKWWSISVPELRGVHSQARRLDQVEDMAREAVALMLDVSPRSFEVEVRPEISAEVAAARQARAKLVEAERSAERATVDAAKTLLEQGYTVRDAGSLLGISPQRVSQLTSPLRQVRRAGRSPQTARSAARKRKAVS
ncbi:type II toxin-antitoxin system HicB family antitoxin [Micromonospora sp. WMMD987]|jgi:predicted RNase H-like HicB family nuclease|uniref:type II toxin-antitoxin system HicB family antitoxin n=1 Tax=Micromonospora TaxID=1873 RepID=UPI00249C1978|nr:type II toxin-antitoxin system HicB family antitoxin [Micromonospora sp. WMMD987]WFE94231.1 type II toxin-antitoxin system HicB family antitoxin [Micromonospora sp. WMMD987]